MSVAPLDSNLIIQSLDSLPARPVAWLWPGRLARGKLAIFDGDPGMGKSLVTLDLCARISTGRPFPDGAPAQGPADVLIFYGEDPAEDVVNPRLDSLGADRARVFHVHRTTDYLSDSSRGFRGGNWPRICVVNAWILGGTDIPVCSRTDRNVGATQKTKVEVVHSEAIADYRLRTTKRSPP